MDFVLILRVKRVATMFENLEEVTLIRQRFAAIIDLGKLIYLLIFVNHICACAWHFLGAYEI
jgi:potassium voltage-gated channel Eag-related subfamily H protein 5